MTGWRGKSPHVSPRLGLTLTLTRMAVLQFVPGSASVFISFIGAERRILRIFPNSDRTFFQGAFQVENAWIRTFCNNMMKVRPVTSG